MCRFLPAALAALLLAVAPLGAASRPRRFELVGQIVSSEPRLFVQAPRFVALFPTNSRRVSRTTVDSKGRFRFKKLEQGTYVLVFGVPRSRPARRTVEIGPSMADNRGRVTTSLVFERRGVTGRSFAVPADQLAVPESARVEFFRGREYLARDETDRARAAFLKAAEIAPQFALAWSSLGNLELQAGQYEEAERAFRRAIDLNPAFYASMLNLGTTLLALGRLDDALAIHLRAVKARPDDPQAEAQLGHTYFRMKRFGEAEAALRRVKALEPEHFTFPQLTLAQIAVGRSDYPAAVRELEEFLRLHPDSESAAEARGALEVARQRAQAPSPARPDPAGAVAAPAPAERR
jgi:tetratricopeptide (TPR) repeat protein